MKEWNRREMAMIRPAAACHAEDVHSPLASPRKSHVLLHRQNMQPRRPPRRSRERRQTCANVSCRWLSNIAGLVDRAARQMLKAEMRCTQKSASGLA